jgi:hypothetical protein
MKDNLYDTPPPGYTRVGTKKGWAVPAKTPQSGKLAKIKQENEELKHRLTQLEELVKNIIK